MDTARPSGCAPDITTIDGTFTPLTARTSTVLRPVEPVAYNCVKLMVIRSGSAILLSEFGETPVRDGDVILLAANILCGSEPEGQVTTTVIYLDTDFLVDQLFWQHSAWLKDYLDAQVLAETIYTEPAQIMRLGKDHKEKMTPWLDEMVTLSMTGNFSEHFHRLQTLWHQIIEIIAPSIRISSTQNPTTENTRKKPTVPRSRRFSPLRREAAIVRDLLHESISEQWTLTLLAEHVHLSPKQLSRIFTDTFGKTPLAYLTMLRVQEMARLLRETDITIAEAGRYVGWHSRSRAGEAFFDCTGVAPNRYRTMVRDSVPAEARR